jgi:hypothetical protein
MLLLPIFLYTSGSFTTVSITLNDTFLRGNWPRPSGKTVHSNHFSSLNTFALLLDETAHSPRFGLDLAAGLRTTHRPSVRQTNYANRSTAAKGLPRQHACSCLAGLPYLHSGTSYNALRSEGSERVLSTYSTTVGTRSCVEACFTKH